MATRLNVSWQRAFQRSPHRASRGIDPEKVGALAVCFAVGTAIGVSACAQGKERTYSADPIAAWVIDADTSARVEGVHVVAGWELKGGMEGGNTVGWFKTLEAVTDESGRFSIPSWGPERRRVRGVLRAGAPVLIFFKSGYQYLEANNLSVMKDAPSHTQSYWNGKTIKLQKFEGSLEEYAEQLSLSLGGKVDQLLGNEDCNWKGMPKFLWAVQQQNEIFRANKTRQNLRGLAYWTTSYPSRCGKLSTYVEEHGK